MKLTVLGKYGPYAAAGGGTSSYLVQSEDTAVVLDFGSGAFSRLQKYMAPEKICAIVLSHLHNDHICDLLPFSYYLQAHGLQLDLILPDTDCPQRKFLALLDGFRFVSLPQNLHIGTLDVSFARMEHPIESYAVKVQSGTRTLCYSGDTSLCPQLASFVKGSDLLLLDCGKPENSTAPHLSLAEATRLAETSGVPVIASHLHPALRYVSTSALVSVAEEGKTYTV